ncbi:MAG: tyrosine-type recombinase/integrase [Planctomycetes bacterium]|nr:tyrosine-type recombinase/integrase [Planctomycetota bacterium]
MATIYKKKYPIPMPQGAEVVVRNGRRFARWTNAKNQTRTADVLDDGRIEFVSDCWYMRYRDAEGVMRRGSTGCRDKQAAQKKLADVLADVEKVHAGIITSQEKQIAAHGERSLNAHLDDYLLHLSRKRIRGRKVSSMYRTNLRGRLDRLVTDCGWRRLRDITRERMERWLDEAEAAELAASTRNEYLISLSALCNWAVKTERLSRNPVAGIGKADRSSDRRHVRRALTADEVVRLLDASRRRPIAELGRKPVTLSDENKRGHRSWTKEQLSADNFERCYADGLQHLAKQHHRRINLETIGRERALFYLLAVSTGLRHGELASLTLGQLHLNAEPTPYLELNAEDAKSGHGANIPLRVEVVDALSRHLADRPGAHYEDKLFVNPPVIRIFDADCQAAGIPKTNERGRVVDIHALRSTFCTHLAVAGVHPRTAMAAMRHSRMELTMVHYTDPTLLDVAGAVNSLPAFASPNATRRLV